MSRITAWITGLSAIVGELLALQAGLAQLLPSPIQKYFNEKVRDSIETYLTFECNLSGDWICKTSGCANPPERQASVKQDGYKLFFQNENMNDPDSAGVWVRPRLVFVPRYDPGHGGDFGEISKDCQKITWSDGGAVWEKKPNAGGP